MMILWPDTFVEHLTGKTGPVNEELFNSLLSTLTPRRKEAVLLHFRQGLPYRIVGDRMGGITGNLAMQLAERGVRDIRERITMDTGVIPLLNEEKHGPALRMVIAGTVEEYEALIIAKQQRKTEAAARALEKHSSDSIDILMLTLPTHHILQRAGIETVGQLAALSKAYLRSLGRVNMENILSRLGNLGIRLR